MEHRACGHSGLSLSALGGGCWAFGGGEYWGAQDQIEVERVVRAAVEIGITYFDAAEAYNDGRSEESLGTAPAWTRLTSRRASAAGWQCCAPKAPTLAAWLSSPSGSA